MTSTRRATIERRLRTIPTMLAATAAALVLAPVALPALAGIDLLRAKPRLPRVRSYLFVLQYLVNDSVEIIAAPMLWLAAGAGRRLDSPASINRHERLQSWSSDLLVARAGQLLGLRLDIADDDLDALGDGPTIVVSRHVSVFDSSLPGIVAQRAGRRARGVIMAEMLADPGFDLIYGRTGSVFIPRDDGPGSVSAIASMTERADDRTALVIFPEGRLFTPTALSRALDRISSRDPVRASRLESLTRLLPPRPGGLLALLDALPTAAVVVVDHRGLDRVPRLADLADAVPLTESVRVTTRRIDRADIPDDPDGRVEWLDQLWLRWDAELGDESEDYT